MKNKYIFIISRLVAALLVFLMLIPVVDAEKSDINTAIDGIISFNDKSGNCDNWIKGSICDNAGISSEWNVFALRQYNPQLDFTPYSSSLKKYIFENGNQSAVVRQKYALALIACGDIDDEYLSSVMDETIGGQGIMSVIFGLHLINNGAESSKFTKDELITELLSMRIENGTWPLMGNGTDIDVTAMALQALAPYYGKNESVSKAVDTALSVLSGLQLENGGFISYGSENSECSAMVIVALSSLGIDAQTDERFTKPGGNPLSAMLSFRLNDGSFCHIKGGSYDGNATSQAFCALVSLMRYRSGKTPLFIFDADETKPENPTPTPQEIANTPQDTKTPILTESPAITQTPPETAKATENSIGVKTEPAVDGGEKAEGISYKAVACIIIFALAVLAFVLLWLFKKRSLKNFIFVLLIAAAAITIVLITDIKTANDYYGTDDTKTAETIGNVTITIRTDTLIGKSDKDYIPKDGVILALAEFPISDGDTVFDVLTAAVRKNGIQMDSESAGQSSMCYVKGIGYIYEFDFGDLSGWIYRVNGDIPGVGCGEYKLSDGDKIEWLYSCNLGKDI